MIPDNIPAIAKYLPFLTMTLGLRIDDEPYFQECVRHGMKVHAKTQAEAVMTEKACVKMMIQTLSASADEQHQLLFEIRTAYSESAKCRGHYKQYLVGNGVEIGSGGYPMAENAIQIELSPTTFAKYTSGRRPEYPIQWASDNRTHPFHDNAFDWVASSHLLEDFADWMPPLTEWARLVKPGGYLVILLPDRARWMAALRRGQPPNCAHRHEAYPGELSQYANRLRLTVVEDRLVDPADETNYNILFVGRKQ